MLAVLEAPVDPGRPSPHPGPRVRHAQQGASSDAADAIFLASSYGMAPDDWQEPILHDWLARRADGKFCHGRCGLAVPRQNGKNGVIEIRELFGMIVLGEAILHSAHEVKTARKAFARLKSFFGDKAEDPKAKYPELNALVASVRATNGQEAIFLKDRWRLPNGEEVRSTGRPEDEPGAVFVAKGGQIEVVARSAGSGRGFTVDVLVLDEAQHLDDDELEAIRSAVSSAPLGDPQVIYAGTPPNREKKMLGTVWLRIRALAEVKDPRLAWTEYGVPDGPMPDINDLELLYAVNPALGVRHANGAFGLQMDTVVDERGELSPEGVARERYGWWGDPATAKFGIFGAGKWQAAGIVKEDRSLVLRSMPDVEAIGIGVSVGAEIGSIGSVGFLDDGRALLGVTDRRAGTKWIPAEAKRIQDKYDIAVVIDEGCPDADLIQELRDAGVELTVMKLRDWAEAVSRMRNEVRDLTVAHLDDPVLNAAVEGAAWNMYRDQQIYARQKSSADISMLEAVTAALRGAVRRESYDLDDSYL